MYHKVTPPYLKRGFRFLKNHLRVDQDFLVKNEEGGGFHLQYLFFFYLLFIPEIVIDLNQVSAC